MQWQPCTKRSTVNLFQMQAFSSKTYAIDFSEHCYFRPNLLINSSSGKQSSCNIKTYARRDHYLLSFEPDPKLNSKVNCKKRNITTFDIHNATVCYDENTNPRKRPRTPTIKQSDLLSSQSKLPIWKRHYANPTNCQYDAFLEMQYTVPSFFHLSTARFSLSKRSKTQQSLSRIIHDSVIRICELFLFCHERQQIWYKRKCNMPRSLWTRDELLSTKHFTNIYRELDRGTIYFQRHIMKLKKEYFDVDSRDSTTSIQQKMSLELEVLWAAICYRLLNRIETFEKVGGIPKIHQWNMFETKLLDLRKNSSLFTGAHQSIGFRRYLETLHSLQVENCSLLCEIMGKIKDSSSVGDLELCTKAIQSIINVGQFFAWQITCDLMECDVMGDVELDWVQLGPGAAVSVILNTFANTMNITIT